jgi:bifunctional non-homologous end joining protein LigD
MTLPSLVSGVFLSHPDKALWPDAGDGRPVTKLDLARYLVAAGPWMLGHLRGRPCSIVRAPDGILGPRFFQRHAGPGLPATLGRVRVRGDPRPYFEVDDVRGLAAIAQLAGLELHPWNSAPASPGVAGRLVFDLDPAPGVEFAAVLRAARDVRERLAALRMPAFCKTTGGRGLHVVVPLAKSARGWPAWPAALGFARGLCEGMAADDPGRYVVKASKAARENKVFLDYLRNTAKATAVAPLSPRARAGAPVSMPIGWEDLRGSLDPGRYTIRTALDELERRRAWANYERSGVPLPSTRQPKTGPAVLPGSGSKRTRTRALPRTRRSGKA